jgi:hypothetical protein
MKTLLTLFVLQIMFSIVAPATGDASSRPQQPTQSSAPLFSLAISLDNNTVKSGSFVDLRVLKKNVSREDLGAYRIVGSAEDSYEIEVTDASGHPAAETSYGRKLHGKEPNSHFHVHHSRMWIDLKPGDTLEESVYLSDIYDFTQTGKYTVQVSQTIFASQADAKANLKTTIKSNLVTLTVRN